MLLLEHDAKALLAERGVPVPEGVLVASSAGLDGVALPPGPWMVKAQVAAGGRGKAGLIAPAASIDEVRRVLDRLAGRRHAGKPVQGFRIEQRIDGAREAYASVSVDAAARALRVLVSETGGIDVETRGGARTALAAPGHADEAAREAVSGLAPEFRKCLGGAAAALCEAFAACEALLLEVNPLFVLADGRWVAGDARLVLDQNALVRRPRLRALLEARAEAYPEAALKLAHGFDYVEVDAEGEIGLVTTGAGLSMQLIDELRAEGCRPLDFCDIRAGQLRGDPARLIAVARWIAARPSVRVVLVNIFAGITDLGEFARLLVAAMGAVPELRVPVVARLVGRNLGEARQVIAAAALPVTVEPDLERALALVRAELRRG